MEICRLIVVNITLRVPKFQDCEAVRRLPAARGAPDTVRTSRGSHRAGSQDREHTDTRSNFAIDGARFPVE
jgi:hypothetical protein